MKQINRWRRLAGSIPGLIVASACSSGPRITSEPAALRPKTTQPEASSPSGATGGPQVDWRGIPPNRRGDVLKVMEQTFCPACPCAQSVAICLTPEQACDCPDCAGLMARYILNAFRYGYAPDDVEDQIAQGWIDGFSADPFQFETEGQPSRRPAEAEEAAPIEVVEFADFTCPHCADVAPVLDALTESRPAVRQTFFFYPLRSTGLSIQSAEAAYEAHRQGKFWAFSHRLFAAIPFEEPQILAVAREVGVDAEAIQAAWSDRRHRPELARNKDHGVARGVLSTPSLFVNGRRFTLPRTLENLEIWVDMERSRSECRPRGSDATAYRLPKLDENDPERRDWPDP